MIFNSTYTEEDNVFASTLSTRETTETGFSSVKRYYYNVASVEDRENFSTTRGPNGGRRGSELFNFSQNKGKKPCKIPTIRESIVLVSSLNERNLPVLSRGGKRTEGLVKL